MVLLFHPRAARERFRLPMSLLALASVVWQEHQTHIIDGDLSHEPLTLLRRALRAATTPPVIGMSVMPGPQLAHAWPITLALKREFPDVPIVWGGWFPSLHAQTCLGSAAVDYVVRGRAEASFPELVRRLSRREDVSDLPNLSWRDAGGAVHHNPEGPLVHPDRLPPLPYHLIDLAAYHCKTFIGARTTAYHSSYGCPLRCGFCAVAAQYNGRWLAESVPHMMANVGRLIEAGADGIELCDNNFFVQEARTEEWCRAMDGRGVGWWGEGTIEDLLSYRTETLRRMRASGCRMIFFGAESGSDEVLRQMNKGRLQTRMILELAKRFAEVDIVPELSFCLGTPPNARENIEASLKLILKVKELNPRAEIILYLYSPEPYQAADLWQKARDAGFSFPTTLEGWVEGSYDLFQMRRQQESPWLTPSDVRRVHDFETVLSAYHPSVADLDVRPLHRRILRTASALRYRTRRFDHPWELKALLKWARYRRVEEEGLPTLRPDTPLPQA